MTTVQLLQTMIAENKQEFHELRKEIMFLRKEIDLVNVKLDVIGRDRFGFEGWDELFNSTDGILKHNSMVEEERLKRNKSVIYP